MKIFANNKYIIQNIYELNPMLWQSHHRKLLTLAKTSETLTTAQDTVCQFLRKETGNYQQRINLWGAPGVGKTFLAHYLYHHAGVSYFSSVESCPITEISPNSVVVIDNALHDRSSARSIFGEMLWAGASAVILVTRQPIDDVVRRVELGLTTQELAQVEDVMHRLFGYSPLNDLRDGERQRSGIWGRLKVLAEHAI